MIEGNASIGMEIMDEMSDIDYIICPVGGGALIAGISSAFK
jgi:threonine dehydratase